MGAPGDRHHRVRRFASRGVSLLEMVSALAILAMVAAATVSLYWTGNTAHRRARFYSQAQTDIRTALRPMTRVIRLAASVSSPATVGTLNGLASSSNQVIVAVPQGASLVEFRYYVSNGVLYRQSSSQAAPGTPLLTGVTGLSFSYFRTLAGTRTSVDAAPMTATEVQISISARRGSVTTGLTSYVAMRVALTGG